MNDTFKQICFYIYVSMILILILSSGSYLIYYIYVNEVNVCTSNPLVYASNKWEKDYGNPLYGSGSFLDADNKRFTIEFNTTSVSVKNPERQNVNLYDFNKEMEILNNLNNYLKNNSNKS